MSLERDLPERRSWRTFAIVAGDDTAGDFYCKIEAPASSKTLRGEP